MQYRLYQDGEINFTLQAPDNATIAVFAVHDSPEGYFTNLPQISSTQRTKIYLGFNREDAITKTHKASRDFAMQLDLDFEDKTNLGKLEMAARDSGYYSRTGDRLRDETDMLTKLKMMGWA